MPGWSSILRNIGHTVLGGSKGLTGITRTGAKALRPAQGVATEFMKTWQPTSPTWQRVFGDRRVQRGLDQLARSGVGGAVGGAGLGGIYGLVSDDTDPLSGALTGAMYGGLAAPGITLLSRGGRGTINRAIRRAQEQGLNPRWSKAVQEAQAVRMARPKLPYTMPSGVQFGNTVITPPPAEWVDARVV